MSDFMSPDPGATPEDHAKAMGRYHKHPAPKVSYYAMDHACASIRHGWTEHEHHAGKPMVLSLADYEAACSAAMCNSEHTPAVSPHRAYKTPPPEPKPARKAKDS